PVTSLLALKNTVRIIILALHLLSRPAACVCHGPAVAGVSWVCVCVLCVPRACLTLRPFQGTLCVCNGRCVAATPYYHT
ncbi:hypothetical protein BC629DRAFT_1556100, partial [Irpex lacteus]